MLEEEVVLGPNRAVVEEERGGPAEHTAAVLASGGLGLVYLQDHDHRLSLQWQYRVQ